MEENNNINHDIAVRYIQQNYSVAGEDKDYVTYADIVREISEMATVTVAEISDLMDNASFKLEFIEDKPHWAVYRK